MLMGEQRPHIDSADMQLRDYFAGVALPAVIDARIHTALPGENPDLNQESIAAECYELADAMIEARERESAE
jgi:hypothetical protein